MSLNYQLRLAAEAAGVALTNQGLSTFLGTQGYSTGSLNDRLQAYLIGKGYSGSLNDMLLKSLTAGDLFSAGYPLSFATLGISATGFILDGSASAFCTDSAGTTPCATSSSDPAGYIEDMSGNENHAIQSTSALKPVYYESGTIKTFRLGTIAASSRYLDPTNALYSTSAITVIAVFKVRNVVGDNGFWILTSFRDGGWGSGGYLGALNPHLATAGQFIADSNPSNRITANGNAGGPITYYANRAGTGLNQATITCFDEAGTQTGTETGSQDANPANPLRIGLDTLSAYEGDVAFLMVVNDSISAGQWATIKAHLVSEFGAFV